MKLKKYIFLLCLSYACNFYGMSDDNSLLSIKESADVPPLIQAIIRNDLETVCKICESDPEQINRPYQENIPFYYACRDLRLDIAEYLIKKGSSVDCILPKHETPLHQAACWDQLNLIKLILENGGQKFIEMKNDYGETPLIASREYIGEIPLCLIKAGASILERDPINQEMFIDRIVIDTIAAEYIAEAMKYAIEQRNVVRVAELSIMTLRRLTGNK